jgi:hypothetical protein
VAAELGRSGLGCRNRWRLLERKKASHSSRTPASSSSCCSHGNESEAAEDKDGISSENPPAPSTQGSEGPPSPLQSTTSANDILSQIQYDPFRLDGSFFNSHSLGTDFSHCLDPELPGVGNVDGQTTLQFDARLWDIMQGGCGCGCGSKAVCGCGDDMTPPFMDISSQDFFGPFHQMTQAFSHGGDPSLVLTSSSHFPQFVESQSSPFDNKSLAPAPLSIPPALPSQHSQPMSNLHGPREPLDFTGETPLAHYAQESNHNLPNFQSPIPPPGIRDNRAILDPSSSNSTLLPPMGYKPETNRQQQEQLSPASSPRGRLTYSDQRAVALSPALVSTNSTPVDSMKWTAAAASLLARIKDQPPCKCSGSCCASTQSTCSHATATSTLSCCSSTKATGVKRPSSPIEPSLSLSNNGFPPVMKRLKRQSSSASGVSINPTPRLSSHLQASSNSNSQLLPYACGDPTCWLSENDIRARFNTSGELLDHHRKVHHDVVNEAVEGRIFRCALEGCGKGWKVGASFRTWCESGSIAYRHLGVCNLEY